MGKLKNDLRKKRKLNENTNYELTSESMKIWEELRKKDTEQLRREQLIDKLIEMIIGNLVTFVRKHDTVRLIETVIQYANEKQRNQIFEELKDEIIELTKLKYGKFFVLKMLKYGTNKHKQQIISSFYGHVPNLLNHSCAASVLEIIYNEHANVQQRNQLVQEYFGSEFKFFKDQDTGYLKDVLANLDNEKKDKIMNHFKEQLNKLSSKVATNFSITHYLYREFFKNAKPEDRNELAQSLAEKAVEILHTRDGSRVALYTLWYGSAKERKTMIKSFKKFVANTAKDENGHYVLLGCFDCVDDTKLIEKNILNELFSKENIVEIASNKYGCKVLEFLLSPRDTRFFHPDQIVILAEGDDNPYSKKDKDIRAKELREAASPMLLNLIVEHCPQLIESGSTTLVFNILTNAEKGDRHNALVKLVDYLAGCGELKDDEHQLIKRKDLCFLIKKLIQTDKLKLKENEDYETFSKVLVDNLPESILKSYSSCNKGCFILLSLIETDIDYVKNKIKKLVDTPTELKQLKALSKKSKGAELLLTKLK